MRIQGLGFTLRQIVLRHVVLVVTCLLTSMSGTARAAIIALNDPSLPASADGFNLTRDTISNLEWLDVDITLGRTFDDLIGNDGSNEFASGGDFEGFRHANRLELAGTGSVSQINGLIKNFALENTVFSIAAYTGAPPPGPSGGLT